MSEQYLHFLNGDSTKSIFDQTNIQGDVAVMRETFCMGPVASNFTNSFWQMRQKWFNNNYFVSAKEYELRVLIEFLKANDPYDQIFIWYEYDVYCQINMIYLVEYIQRHSKAKINLVYSDKGLGTLSSNEYHDLLNNAQSLGINDLQQCRAVYHSICSNDIQLIQECIKSYNSKLENLSNSLRAYIAQNLGPKELRPIDLRIRELIQAGISNGKEIVVSLLHQDNIYGYGDLQFMIILASMHRELKFDPIKATNTIEFIDKVFKLKIG